MNETNDTTKVHRENNAHGNQQSSNRDVLERKGSFTIGTVCSKELNMFEQKYNQQLEDLIRRCDVDKE